MSILSRHEIERQLKAFTGEDERPEPAERRRQRIVQAATALFIQHGYRKTSIDEVAAGAGVAKGTVYLYAKNKADLLFQAIAEEKKQWLGSISELFADDIASRERLKRYVRLSLTLSARMPLVSRLTSGDRELLTAMDELDVNVQEQMNEMGLRFLGTLLAEAAPSGFPVKQIKARARTLRAALMAVLMADARVHDGLSPERFADSVADLLIDGVLGDKSDPDEGGNQ